PEIDHFREMNLHNSFTPPHHLTDEDAAGEGRVEGQEAARAGHGAARQLPRLDVRPAAGAGPRDDMALATVTIDVDLPAGITIPATSAWHHLGRLYLASAEMRG